MSYIENKCHSCKFKRSVPGNCHIQCVKPDPKITSDDHGIRNGWFFYPLLFDPTWMTSKCNNFEQK